MSRKSYAVAALILAASIAAPAAVATGAQARSAQEEAAAQEEAVAQDPVPLTATELILQETAAGQPREDLGLKHRVDFFPSLDGKALTLVIFEVHKQEILDAAGGAGADDPWAGAAAEAAAIGVATGPSVKVFGNVSRDGAMGPELVHGFDVACPVSGAEDDDFTPTHSIGFGLEPGTYTLTWGILDEASGMATSAIEQIEVPDFLGGELMLTSVLATTGVSSEAEQMRANAVYSGIKIGNLLFEDDLDRVFARDANVELVYAVMGAQMASVEQPEPADPNAPPPPAPMPKPALEIQYRILMAETGQSVVRFPPMPLDRTTVGQPIPLGRIQNLAAGGSYDISISVTDTVTGNVVEATVPFSIAAEAAPDEGEQQ